jgi:RHS repeat-associated protein
MCHRVPLLIFALLLNLAWGRLAAASDPGNRTFTALGGGRIGGDAVVGARGNLGQSLPLELPHPRGDVPMPFAVTYNGSSVIGAGGMGWDISVAGVLWQHNLSGRKPVHRMAGVAEPATAERIFVDLGAGPMTMAPTEVAGVYQSLRGAYFELDVRAAQLIGRDGNGRRWFFQQLAPLLDADFYVLTTIIDSTGQNRVDFSYDVYDRFSDAPIRRPFSSSEISMREFVLREIAHSYVPVTGSVTGPEIPTNGSMEPSMIPALGSSCPKYRIQFDYRDWRLGYPASYPQLLSISFHAGRPRAHTRLLEKVWVRSNTDTACRPRGLHTDRTYLVSYAPDTLTGQPRLQKLDWFGRDDSALAAGSGLPVVAYRYGSVLKASSVRFLAAERLTLPPGPPEVSGLATSYGTGAGSLYGLVRGFRDFNGDGRADFLTLDQSAQQPILAINRPSTAGDDASTFPARVTLPNSPAAPYTLGAPDLSFGLPVLQSLDNTYQQIIDFNGDGRPDILVATEGRNARGARDPNFWMLLLNMAGPSAQPGDIRWLQRHIEITEVRRAIQSRHVLSLIASSQQETKPLPLSRTTLVGAFAGNVTVESGTVSQWELMDVNADGFPDMVYVDREVTATEGRSCDVAGKCQDVVRQDHPASTRLMVIYHTGPMMAGSGAGPQGAWRGPAVLLRSDGSCGVERLMWLGGGRRRLACGFMEVNGDGIRDYVTQNETGMRAVLSSGLAQAHDVRLPDNLSATDYSEIEQKRSIQLPGPVGVVKDPRSEACGANAAGNKRYLIEQLTALRDITGDGIADYVYRGSRHKLEDGTQLLHPATVPRKSRDSNGWWLMPGTGVGFAAAIRIQTPKDFPFALHSSSERCDGKFSNVQVALQDIDGDGRQELLRVMRDSTVQVAKLADSEDRLGAHGAGQLVAIDNRYGGTTHVTFGSAKSNWNSRGHYPYPEIVVTQTEVTADRGFGDSLAPVRYAYGNPDIRYDSTLGRWVFAGYGRRVTLFGERRANSLVVKGHAIIVSSISPGEFSLELERSTLSGRPRDANTIASSILPSDPRLLLSQSSVFAAIANEHSRWKIQPRAASVPPLVPLEEECYSMPSPNSPGTFGDLSLCRRTASAYVTELTRWQGAHPYPAADSVATRSMVNAVDRYARPTNVRLERDRSRPDDDMCVQIAYASAAQGYAPFLDAPHTMRIQECGNPARVLAGVRFLYDDLPEGQVGAGLASGQVIERHDVQSAALLDQHPTYAVTRDVYGNPARFTRNRPDGATSTTTISYDPFGLAPVAVQTTASGLAQPFNIEIERDRQTLQPLTVWNQHRSGIHQTFDSFGRLVRTSVTKPGEAARYVLQEVEYLGFESSFAPRSVRLNNYSGWVPEALASQADPGTVRTYTEVMDELGRRTHGIIALGSDYNNQTLITDYVIHDGLGRVKFEAIPFAGFEFGPHYGVTYSYASDGRLACATTGEGVQTSTTTDESVSRYPTCFSYLYAAHQALRRIQGPNELAAGKPQSGAFDEETLTATGEVIRRARVQAGKKLSLIEYGYDRLGQMSEATRWADPDTMSGSVKWSWSNDSAGNVLAVHEPAAARRFFSYDAWGNLTNVHWTDASGQTSLERGMAFDHDGLSRLTRMIETSNGAELAASLQEYHYDVTSGQPQHLDATYMLGELAWTRTRDRMVFLGYDSSGHRTTTTHADVGSPDYYGERQVVGPDGETSRLEFLQAGGGAGPVDSILYDYDSARRLKAVRLQDAGGTSDVWRALRTDIFGRVLQNQLGNGATLEAVFRPEHRREIQRLHLESPGGARTVEFGHFDGSMLLDAVTETSTLGPVDSAATSRYSFDQSNALARVTAQSPDGTQFDTTYRYDGLGNLTQIDDALANSHLRLPSDTTDHDRLCTIAPQVAATPACSYQFDALGNVRAIGGSAYTYDVNSRIRSAESATQRSQFDYDSFGGLSALRSTNGTLQRRESFYGGATRTSFFDASGQPTTVGSGSGAMHSFVERLIESPVGTVAVVRRSNTGASVVLYPVGESQGARVVLDQNGAVTQSISYTPYGAATSDPPNADSLTWWPYQWNGGRILDERGMTLIGERVLDGASGRFLQRDPMINIATSVGAHPYAFAWNNPVTFTDVSGAEPQVVTAGLIERQSKYRADDHFGPKAFQHHRTGFRADAITWFSGIFGLAGYKIGSQFSDAAAPPDWAGLDILRRWLDGGGDWYIYAAGKRHRWKDYMLANKNLQRQIYQQLISEAASHVNDSGIGSYMFTRRFDGNTGFSTNVPSGYGYLHGTDATVGGLEMSGTYRVQKVADGGFVVAARLLLTWNDRINPNGWQDAAHVAIGEALTFGTADSYKIAITWDSLNAIYFNSAGEAVRPEHPGTIRNLGDFGDLIFPPFPAFQYPSDLQR